LTDRRSRRAAARAIAAGLLSALAAPAAARVVLPPPGGRSVQDFARVVEPADAQLMERRHRELFDKTGVAIVVVTEPDLEGEPLEDFAVRAGAEWGVGKKGQDRGIVVAFVVEGPHIFVATGYGVEGFLPDGRVGAILDRWAVPALRQGRYSEALRETSATLAAACAAEYHVAIESLGDAAGRALPGMGGPQIQISPAAALLALLVGIVLLVMLVRHPILFLLLFGRGGYYGGWRGGGFGGGFGGSGGGFGGFGGGGFGGGGAGR
jgi:uncharacterized protein